MCWETYSLCSSPSWVLLGLVRTIPPLLNGQVASKEYRFMTRRTWQSKEENCRGVGEDTAIAKVQMPETDQGT